MIGLCAFSWPGGYCTATCTDGSQCGANAYCVADVINGVDACVARCPAPGTHSTCRPGYTCRGLNETSDGFCGPEEAAGGAGGGSGSGGAGGGNSLPTTISYRVTSIQGSYSGDGTNVVSSARTDTLAMNTCTLSSSGTAASQSQFIGESGSTVNIGVTANVMCPAGHATSTAAAACKSQVISIPTAALNWKVGVTGWTNESFVTFHVTAPSGLPGCNYASVIMDASQPWQISSATTVAKFRAGVAFPVRFVGSRMLATTGKTSSVSWDFTMMIQPL